MTFSSLLSYLTPHRRVLLAVILLMLAGSAASLAQPWLAGQLTSTLLEEPDTWGASYILTFWLGLLITRSGLDFVSQYYIGSTGESLTANLRSRLFQHLQALPIGYYQDRRRGDVLAMLSNDADHISDFVTHTLVQLLPLLLTFVGAFIAMFWLDPVIALLAMVLLPVYFLVMKVVGRRIRPLSKAWIDAYSNLVSFLEEHLAMLGAVKSFVREPIEAKLFETKNSHLLSLSKQQLLIQSLLSPAVGLLAGLGLLLLLSLGTDRVANGQLSPGELVTLLLYAMLMSQPLRGLANVYGQIQQTRGAAERILEFLGQQPETTDNGLPDLMRTKGDIRFENIDFTYPGGKPVFCGFDLHIRAGETVALTGSNGAGKTTLSFLLMRMAEPEQGRILIDGVDISKVNLASLRRQIGVVAQHTLLLNATVAENIAYGLPLVDQTGIESAARKAGAHEFILDLPQGYKTLIGDQGMKLSGGQRQRISLARTLLTDPLILIFDEATSMLDHFGEAWFIGECRKSLKEKTVIIITHRPASLALAERSISLEPTGEEQDPSIEVTL
ncbi:MAG: ABC transporter ATP-binding protein [Halioglobus sp.]